MSKISDLETVQTYSPQLAKLVGEREAMFLHQLNFLLTETSMGRVIDGKRWVHKTYAEWLARDFPHWSQSTLQRVIGKLVDAGYVQVTSRHNRRKTDKTWWYALDAKRIDEALRSGQIDHMEEVKLTTPDVVILTASIQKNTATEEYPKITCGVADAPPKNGDREIDELTEGKPMGKTVAELMAEQQAKVYQSAEEVVNVLGPRYAAASTDSTRNAIAWEAWKALVILRYGRQFFSKLPGKQAAQIKRILATYGDDGFNVLALVLQRWDKFVKYVIKVHGFTSQPGLPSIDFFDKHREIAGNFYLEEVNLSSQGIEAKVKAKLAAQKQQVIDKPEKDTMVKAPTSTEEAPVLSADDMLKDL